MVRLRHLCLFATALGAVACPSREDTPEPVKVEKRPATKADAKGAAGDDAKAPEKKAKSAPLPKDRDLSMGKTYDDELATLRARLEQQI